MSICPGCGGVIGRDCFNTVECQQIAASMNNQAEYENEQLKNELQRLQASCIQKDEEIARLRAEIKEHVENVNMLGRMQSDAMGRIVQLKKQLGQSHVHTNDLLDFFMGELWAYMTNLEGVHIGSNDLSKDQVMRFVFEQAKEIMAFLNYAGWCNSSFREGQTWEQFVDWQLDELNKDNTDPQRKEFIKKFIAKFNQTINP